jgi:NADPH:quinone reductase-like Zn-dependent oxidoreductase
MQYVTAYGALVEVAQLQAGETLLLTGATGGLGVAGIQIARRLGAKVVATTRKPEKRSFLVSLRPDRVVVTSEEDLAATTREISGPQGPRVILDAVMGQTLPMLADLVSPGGIIVAYGAMHKDARTGTAFPLREAIRNGLTLRGYTLFELTWDPARFGADAPYDPVRYVRAVRFVESGIAGGSLKPVISKVFPFERIAEAHAFVEGDEQAGKVVVRVGS